MAVLTDPDRFEIWARLMRDFIELGFGSINLSKTDLRAAVNATDDWIDANQVAYNNTLPVAARTNLTVLQKTLLFYYVSLKRAGH